MISKDCREAILADKELERVSILEGIETVREECFSHGSVKAVHISASVQKISDGNGYPPNGFAKFGTFHGCKNLRRVTFAEGSQLKEIGWLAFFECKMLQNIILPESVETLGGYSFYQAGLTEITIPKNTRSIGEYAFYEC